MDKDLIIFAKAIADDTRMEIMHHLCGVSVTVNDVVDKLNGKVKQPTVSHHLKLLEEANLVKVRQEGRQRYYTLNQDRVTLCCGTLVERFAPDGDCRIIRIEEFRVED